MTNFFTDLIESPIITILTLGFYVKDLFASWGLISLGWTVCIVIEVVIILSILALFSWVYRTAKKIVKSFKE